MNIPSKDVSQMSFFSSLFPFYSCEFQFGVSYRETHNNAVRFHFVIRQSLGAIGERLYLHCNVTICRRKDAPEPTIFNCFTHGEYCPNKTAELITKGPFVVWPFITKEERYKHYTSATQIFLMFPHNAPLKNNDFAFLADLPFFHRILNRNAQQIFSRRRVVVGRSIMSDKRDRVASAMSKNEC